MKINSDNLKLAMLQAFQSGFYSFMLILCILYLPMSFVAMSFRCNEWYVWERVIFAIAWVGMWLSVFLDMPEVEVSDPETEEEQEEQEEF